MSEPVLTVDEFARGARYSRKKVYRMLRQGEIPFTRAGEKGHYRIPASELENMKAGSDEIRRRPSSAVASLSPAVGPPAAGSSAAGSPEEERFISVPLGSLRADSWMNFSTYVRVGGKHVLYRDQSYPVFGVAALRRLLQNRVQQLFIKVSDRTSYLEYAKEHLSEVLSDSDVAPLEKAKITYNTGLHLAEAILTEPATNENVVRAEQIIASVVDHMLIDLSPFHSLLSLLSHRGSIYVHSANVAVYSLLLAYRCGIVHSHHLRLIGLGGLLHDIGKVNLDTETQNQPESQGRSQSDVERLHPERGGSILEEAGCMARLPTDIVCQHHERNDGSGYPKGLTSLDIAWEAKLIAILDVYDGLTNNNSHKKRLSPYDALDLMRSEMLSGMDKGIFRNFVFLLGGI